MRRAGDAAALRSAGETLGREGLSRRVIALVAQFQSAPSFKNAIILAGRLSAITVACRWDDYWHEKAEAGFHQEMYALVDLQTACIRSDASAHADSRPLAASPQDISEGSIDRKGGLSEGGE